MAYKLTAADRRAQAALIRAEREARYKKSLPLAKRVAVTGAQKKNEASTGVKVLHTVGDVGANFVTGAAKGLEGIYDLGAGLVGAVGGLFSDEFEDNVKAHIAKDHVGEWFGNDWQEGLDQSYLNDSTVGGIIEGVAQGVGQMLPAVAVTLIPGVGPALGTKLALGTTMASAAGTGTEQAFQDGAGYGQGMVYGAASGAIEGVTEKLLPGAGDLYGKAITKMGKSAAKEIGQEVAEVGIKRVAKEAIGEGAEEVLAELANPALKMIYKGRDALEEYGDSEYWKGVAEAGVVGMGTSAAYSGTVGRMTKTTGKYADARATLEHIEEQQKLRSRADLSQAERVQIEQNIKADNEQFSNRLRKLSDKGRAAVFEKMPQLKLVFDADGSINETQRAALDANIKAAGDSTFDVRYRTATLSADTIKTALENGSTDSHEMQAFSGEMTEEQNRALGEVREIMGAVGERSGNALGGFVITKTSPEGGAYFDPNTRVVTIGADVLKNGNVTDAVTRALEKDGTLGTIVHEVAHGIEETNAGRALAKVLTDDADLHDLAITDVLERGYLKEFFAENGKEADLDTVRRGIERLIERENAGEMLTEGEQAALDEYRSEVAAFANQRLLGNKAFVKKLITTEPSTAEKLIGKIREIRENLMIRNPAAKAQLELVRKAEKLFMQALSQAGGVIDSNGKIHIANREDDELTRDNSEKMHVSDEDSGENAAETVDEKSKVRYNKNTDNKRDYITKRGWAEGILSVEDRNLLREKISEAQAQGFEIHPRLSDGSYLFEVNNKIVLVSGDFESPFYDGIVDINADNADTANTIRKDIENATSIAKGQSGAQFLKIVENLYRKNVLMVYRRTDFVDSRTVTQQQYPTRPDGYKDFGYSREQRYGSRSSRKVKSAHLNDDGSVTYTYSDGTTKTEYPDAPKKKAVRRSRNLVSNDVNVEKAAVEHFGRTYRWAETGYITKAGTRLDFSGRHEGASGGYRTVDHRDIVAVYDDLGAENASGNEAMVDFMARGNVRVMPEGNGINLSVKPTKAQEEILSDFVSKARGEVYVDLDDTNGNTVVSVEYPRGTHASKVLNDIRNWFDHGIEPQISPLAQFRDVRYSRTTTGDVVTISKGELAKLHANYAGEKVFARQSVVAAVKKIDAFNKLPGSMRNEFINRLWKGYNERLHQQGFDFFTEIMWDQLHATVLQENGFEMSEDEIIAMDEQIVAALREIVASGKPSIKAKLESATSTEGYRKQAEFWREEHGRAVERHKMLGTLKYELEKLANQKKGLYVNAANFRGDSFKVAIDELAKMNWRGGLVNDTKIREHFATLAAFYTKKNPLYAGDGNGNELFRQEIADALADLGNSQNGALTVEDLYAAETVVKYFAHEIEAHNTVYKDGKRVDAMPEVKRYIERADRAKMIAAKCGIWSNLMRSSFARMVADPAMLMRQADGYLSGFFTEQYEQLRQGTIDANVKERELSEAFEKFWDEHKAYGKRYNDATVKFGDVEMPLQEAISLYMTMHREHAFAGIAGAGFEIDGKHATENISDGFADEVQKQVAEDLRGLPPEELLTLTKKKNAELERAALKKVVEQKRAALYEQFTAEDKALIEIMERGYEACRDIKVGVDNIVQGYSNVTGGYYYPIRRTGLAESIDAYTGFEGDRVTNLSMNKETVKNAHKLYIEPAHVVYMRHLKATSLYHGLGVFTDNFNRLYNLNTGTNTNNPITVRTALASSNKYVKEMITYFKELKQDVEGISKKRNTEKFYNDAVAFIRSSYATFQLGANPKVWVTQFSSLLAASNLLDMDSITKGLKVGGKDVDEYCRLAWLRNNDDAAAMAQAVSTPTNAVQRAGRNALQKVRDVSMVMIGKVDRLVITRLFGACQLQVEKNGGAKVGTKENKTEAGKLLQRVILETQQNSLATERSAAMRSGDELLKGFTMFSADAMKVGARFVDAFGELSVLRTLLKEANKAGDTKEAERLNGEIKRARKQCVRATAALVGVALFNAALAYGFKWLYRRDEDESVGTVVADTFGNMLGGIPFVRDLWGFFQDGFEMDHFLISTVNDVLGTAAASFQLVRDAASGKEVTKQEALANMRKVLYAAGQLSGVPTRNIYNVATGALNRVSPTTGYKVEGLFTAKAYTSDLEKAIAKDDEKMIGTIAGLMVGEKIGIEDDKMREVLKNLAGEGYSVLPRSVGDTVTLNGEERTLTGRQQKRFRTVYAVGQEAVANMCRLKQFAEVDAETQAKAIQFIYGVYWDLALEDVLGEDLAEKNVLFAEAIDIEKLAIIIAQARSLEADKDKNGKAIAGTKKRKVEQFVSSLRLTAAQKYMVMGYLGYSNANGRAQVESYIGGLKLTKDEKKALLKYSGYAA